MNLAGLTTEEVAERLRQGQVNRSPHSGWAEYGSIVSRNLFTWFNAMVTPAAVALFLLNDYRGAIAVSGMAIVNTVLGLAQELRAKWHLDRLVLLTESRTRVIRDRQVQEISAGDVVLGDQVLLSAGAMIVADGTVLESHFLEVDEALLTGESDSVRRQLGDRLLAGSYCVAGTGTYRVNQVGGEVYANRLTGQARRYHYVASPLTRAINRVILILSYTAIALAALDVALYLMQDVDQTQLVQMVAATITSTVPQGLVLTATISLTLAAVRMVTRGAVVQRLSAVESMAAVDVLCMDKTGTLTTNRLSLDHLHLLAPDVTFEEAQDRLRLFASASVDRQNRVLDALRTELGEVPVDLIDHLPFKAQNRYSAVHIRKENTDRVLVMGACEVLRDCLTSFPPDGESAWTDLTNHGLRVLLFAECREALPLSEVMNCGGLQPLALLAFRDEVRPEAGAVLELLSGQGIVVKLLSGDHPGTVRATVASLSPALAATPVVSGDQLETSTDWTELTRTHHVFGRVVPEQKLRIVQTLQRQGYHVAMIGDGVNDVLPIKQADLGIAMGAGSSAAKTVAGLVLENNDFALLPQTLEEGRTIVRNLRRAAKLFLTKNVYALILIVPGSLGLFDLPFPLLPQQVTLLNWLVIGIPALVIALSHERSQGATRRDFLREVGAFALRTGFLFGIAGVGMLLLSVHLWEDEERTQRTLLLSVLVLLGITALFRALTDGEDQPLQGDQRFRLLAAAVLPVYLTMMYWPPAADFFELEALSLVQWGRVLAVAVPTFGLTLWSDQVRFKARGP